MDLPPVRYIVLYCADANFTTEWSQVKIEMGHWYPELFTLAQTQVFSVTILLFG